MIRIINNHTGSIGIGAVIMLVCFLIIGATAVSVLTETPQQFTEEDYEQIINDVYSEITGYLQIKEVIGKYYPYNHDQAIKKIILLITPLCHINLDLNDIIIELQTKDSVTTICYNQNPNNSAINGLFENTYWTQTRENAFGCFVAIDKDQSIIQYHTINDPTDLIYITILLPENMLLYKGDEMTISLIPGSGTLRSITIEAPLPMRSIVRLYN